MNSPRMDAFYDQIEYDVSASSIVFTLGTKPRLVWLQNKSRCTTASPGDGVRLQMHPNGLKYVDVPDSGQPVLTRVGGQLQTDGVISTTLLLSAWEAFGVHDFKGPMRVGPGDGNNTLTTLLKPGFYAFQNVGGERAELTFAVDDTTRYLPASGQVIYERLSAPAQANFNTEGGSGLYTQVSWWRID